MQSYIHFTREERIKLEQLHKKGESIREIARQLGRSPSSVSRELRRNQSKNGSYHNWRATVLYIVRKRKSHGPKRLREGTELYEFVCKGLDQYWSPECIAALWNKEHPTDRLSFSTIYRWLKAGLLIGYSRKKHLRRRGKRIQTKNANYNTIHPDRLIEQWPDEIKNRLRIGDWEGDTVYGGVGKGFLVTLVDRKSRYLTASLVMSRSPDDTRESMLRALNGMPVKSISLDNGSEFARFHELEKDLNTLVYFAKPHAPWQRGTNENTNGLLRFFYPKGYDFRLLSESELQKVVDLLNNRPRKCLGWKSPAQIFADSVALA